MSASVSFELELRPLERVRSDLVVAGLFEGDRPLRGGAARLDWRLCGLLSELILAEQMVGRAGEAVLLPSRGALRSPRVLIVGLGVRDRYRMAAAQEAMANAMARSFALGVERVALSPLGIASDDVPRHAAAIVGGVLEAARPAERDLSLVLPVAPRQQEPVASALERAIRAVHPAPLRLLEPEPAPTPRPEPPRGSAAHVSGSA